MKKFLQLVAFAFIAVMLIQIAVEFRPEFIGPAINILRFLSLIFVMSVLMIGFIEGFSDTHYRYYSIPERKKVIFFLTLFRIARLVWIFVFLPIVGINFVDGYVIGGCVLGLILCLVAYLIEKNIGIAKSMMEDERK